MYKVYGVEGPRLPSVVGEGWFGVGGQGIYFTLLYIISEILDSLIVAYRVIIVA